MRHTFDFQSNSVKKQGFLYFTLLLTLVFAGELLLLYMADMPTDPAIYADSPDPMMADLQTAAAANPMIMAGAGWTGITNWLINLFLVQNYGPVQVAGAGWTGIYQWVIDLFFVHYETVQVAGAGWTGIYRWLIDLIIVDNATGAMA